MGHQLWGIGGWVAALDDEHAARAHVTTSERLAIMGGSDGGLLMGAVLTEHPGGTA